MDEDHFGLDGVFSRFFGSIFSSTIRGLDWDSMRRVPGGNWTCLVTLEAIMNADMSPARRESGV